VSHPVTRLGRRLLARGRLTVLAVSSAGIVLTGALSWAPAAQAAQGCRLLTGSPIAFIQGDIPNFGTYQDVAAEVGWSGNGYGQLRARTPGAASGIGPWEKFELQCVNGPGEIYAIKSLANNRYVSAEVSWTGNSYGLLRARSTTIGPWEQFHIDSANGTSNRVHLQSTANGRWVSAEFGWTGSSYADLRARATSIGQWETFMMFPA
jgi:hypothetical protein